MMNFRTNLSIFRIVAFVVVTCGATAKSQDSFSPNDKPTLSVTRSAGQIKIDGEFDDDGWQGAAKAGNFSEHSPGDRTKPPFETEVLVTYDDDNLYLGFLCADDPRTVRYSLRDRDEIFDGDYVGILLDTYGDASWAYELFFNPLGCQGDLRMLSNGNEDASFDIVFHSKGRLTEKGFQVEVAVPFSSLRFPNKSVQEWKATFWRNRPRSSRERSTWAAVNRNEPCFICQWGTLRGIENVKPGKNIEILPSVISYQTTHLKNPRNPSSGLIDEKVKAEGSLNARYLVSSAVTADFTYNPDFSQIESDAAQIDVNSPYVLYFPERRPFFQEGSDLFETFVNAVYTRSINDPLMAMKLTGRLNRTAIGYIGARDRKTPLVLPFEESSELLQVGKSYSNVLRVKQTILENSYVGAIMTDRRLDDGGAGSVIGGDVSAWFLKNYRLDIGLFASRTTEPTDSTMTQGITPLTFERGRHTSAFDGESYWGHALYVAVDRNSRVWSSNLSYSGLSPSFRVDNGYLDRNDQQTARCWNGLYFRPNTRAVDEINISLESARVWNFAGQRKDEWLVPELSVLFKRQTQVVFSYLLSRETYRNVYFPGIRRFGFGIESSFSKPVSIGFEFTGGRFVARLVDPPVLGRGSNCSVSSTLRLWQRLVIRPQLEYSKLTYPDGSKIYSGFVSRTRFNYQFNREWFLRLVVQYDDFDRSFSIEPLLSYKLNPFTIFYLGSSHGIQEPGGDGDWTNTGHQYFLKFQYLLRI
jgi:hypothetical protein